MARETLTITRFNRVTTIHPQNRKPVPLSECGSVSPPISELGFVVIRLLHVVLPAASSTAYQSGLQLSELDRPAAHDSESAGRKDQHYQDEDDSRYKGSRGIPEFPCRRHRKSRQVSAQLGTR